MPSETLKNFRGGSYGPPKKRKNWFFADFGGPITSPPQNFQRFWGHFHKPNFLSTIDYRKVNSWKINFWGVNWNFRFLGFLIKNLKLKTLIFGSFWSKMKKLRMDSERKWKVCLIKVPLFLLKNALGASYKRFYIFFVIPLRGHFRHTTPARISISFFLFFHW